jgi:hypothetical protein
VIKMAQTKCKIIGIEQREANRLGARGFSRLVTNPLDEGVVRYERGENYHCYNPNSMDRVVLGEEIMDPKIQNIVDYLTSIKKGDGKRGYCPFVGGIERSNGYYIRRLESADTVFDIYREVVEEEKRGASANLQIGLARTGLTFATLYKTIELELIALLRAFRDLSPQITGEMKGADLQVVIGYFASEEAATEKGCKLIADIKERMRKEVLGMGLMISEMTPHHKIGGITGREELSTLPLYNLEVPVVMVRRMHKEDHAFMRNEEDLKIHEGFFGKVV